MLLSDHEIHPNTPCSWLALSPPSVSEGGQLTSYLGTKPLTVMGSALFSIGEAWGPTHLE